LIGCTNLPRLAGGVVAPLGAESLLIEGHVIANSLRAGWFPGSLE
jgi:hypothetical protein